MSVEKLCWDFLENSLHQIHVFETHVCFMTSPVLVPDNGLSEKCITSKKTQDGEGRCEHIFEDFH